MRKIGAGHKSEVFVQDDGSILKLFVPEFVALAPVEVEIARALERAGVAAPRGAGGRLGARSGPASSSPACVQAGR